MVFTRQRVLRLAMRQRFVEIGRARIHECTVVFATAKVFDIDVIGNLGDGGGRHACPPAGLPLRASDAILGAQR